MEVLGDRDRAFLQARQFGRLATVGPTGAPHVVPVRYHFVTDEGVIEIGGTRLTSTRKYADAIRDPRAAFVVDDLEPPVGGLEVRGHIEVVESGGERIREGFESAMLRLHVEHAAPWGLDRLT